MVNINVMPLMTHWQIIPMQIVKMWLDEVTLLRLIKIHIIWFMTTLDKLYRMYNLFLLSKYENGRRRLRGC